MYGYYKGKEVCIHYTDMYALKWYLRIGIGLRNENGDLKYLRILQRLDASGYGWVRNVWIGTCTRGEYSDMHSQCYGLYRAFNTLKWKWRLFRAKQRCAKFKEELVATALHPQRIEKWVEAEFWNGVE